MIHYRPERRGDLFAVIGPTTAAAPPLYLKLEDAIACARELHIRDNLEDALGDATGLPCEFWEDMGGHRWSVDLPDAGDDDMRRYVVVSDEGEDGWLAGFYADEDGDMSGDVVHLTITCDTRGWDGETTVNAVAEGLARALWVIGAINAIGEECA